MSDPITVKRVLSNNWFLLKIALQEAPLFTVEQLTTRARHRLIVFIEHIYMIGYIIDCIQYEKPFADVFWLVIAVFTFVTLIAHVLPNYVETRLKPIALEKIHRRIRMELYQKASEMDLKNYDDPQYYNEFVWAMSEAAQRTEQVIGTFAMLIGEIVGIFVVGGYVLTRDPFGLLLTAVSLVLILSLSNLYNKWNLRFKEQLKALERKRDYISRVFYLPEYAKELRFGQVKPILYEEFQDTSRQMGKITKKETRRLTILTTIINYFCNTLLFDGVYLLSLLYRSFVKGIFGYGTAVTLYNSCYNLKNCTEMLAHVLVQFPDHGRYIEKIRHFLDCPVDIRQTAEAKEITDTFDTLCLKDVSFSYPDGAPVLDHVNLTIKKGERIAFVGYNGAGKTTLVKLLMRLYDASQGSIARNGTDIRHLNLEQYRGQYAALFQDYQLFAATLGQNIVMDRTPIEEKTMEPLLQKSGFDRKFEQLSQGYETPVTREFEENGVLFSGGEAQMIGICRSLCQDSPILILDEPSSALDPLSEYNLNHTMMNLDRSKTVIFISHRLSTTRLADRIYMLENGRIVEEGSHDELMRQNGQYAAMFRLQMEKYK